MRVTKALLDQDAIDQETVHDKQSYGPGAKRPWTFELLHRAIDVETAGLEARREELAEESDEGRQQLVSVERFVAATEIPATAVEIQRRLSNLGSTEGELQARLERAEEEARAAAAEENRVGSERDGAETELRDARRALAELRNELREVRRAGNQIERDLETAREGDVARRVLEPLPYVICPKCEQSLEARGAPEGHCIVCQQPEPEAELEVAPLQQLASQLEETRALGRQLEEAVADATERAERLQTLSVQRREALATARDEATAPLRASIVRLREELGALRGERQVLATGLPLERAVEEKRSEIAAHGPEISRLGDEAQKRREDLSVRARTRVEEVSDLFSEILHAFSLPWLETAEVDPGSYLPLVNDLSLRRISSGGMKTTTNVAYYLAVFVNGLRDGDVLTPSFQMLDSIRKDSGSGQEDLARSDRIYAYLQTLQELRAGSSPLARDFQLFVVDNDLPSDFERTFNTMRIDPGSPLVRGLSE